MSEVVEAFAFTIGSFVRTFFQMQIDSNITIGIFFIAASILGTVIGLIFHDIKVPGRSWTGRGSVDSAGRK